MGKIGREKALSVGLVGGKIVIEIGVDVLADAITNGPVSDEYSDDGEVSVVVGDTAVFAKSIIEALSIEEEDGATPVHRLFDDAARYALEFGLDGIDVLD